MLGAMGEAAAAQLAVGMVASSSVTSAELLDRLPMTPSRPSPLRTTSAELLDRLPMTPSRPSPLRRRRATTPTTELTSSGMTFSSVVGAAGDASSPAVQRVVHLSSSEDLRHTVQQELSALATEAPPLLRKIRSLLSLLNVPDTSAEDGGWRVTLSDSSLAAGLPLDGEVLPEHASWADGVCNFLGGLPVAEDILMDVHGDDDEADGDGGGVRASSADAGQDGSGDDGGRRDAGSAVGGVEPARAGGGGGVEHVYSADDVCSADEVDDGGGGVDADADGCTHKAGGAVGGGDAMPAGGGGEEVTQRQKPATPKDTRRGVPRQTSAA